MLKQVLKEPAKKIIYVNYCDEISTTKVNKLMAGISGMINSEKPDTIYCLFSSFGGNTESGIALYNFLRSLPVEIVMHNTGNIDSVATIVFLAADIRYASVHSSFLFHGIKWTFDSVSLTKNQLLEILSCIELSESKIVGIVTERTKLTPEEVAVWFTKGESISARLALDKGIVCEIKDPVVPKGVQIISVNI